MSNTTRARELLAGITPGPWERRIGTPDQTPAEYIADTEGVDGEPLHIVIAPSPEEQFAYVVPAITGNGPTSRVNAEFIAAAPQLVADLLSDLATARNVIEEVREHLWKSGPFIASDGEWSYRMVSREELLAILADEVGEQQ